MWYNPNRCIPGDKMILLKSLEIFHLLNKTPLLIFNTVGCSLPDFLMTNPQCVLKLTDMATNGTMYIDDDGMSCSMRFNQVAHTVFVPTSSMIALKSEENDALIPLGNIRMIAVQKEKPKLSVIHDGATGDGVPKANLKLVMKEI